MNLNNFKKEWEKTYKDLPPISYILRENIKDHWFRIHSLPDSKRYAENEKKTEIILERHNDIATEVLGLDEDCLIIIGLHGGKKNQIKIDYSWSNNLNFVYFGETKIEENPDFFIFQYASFEKWKKNKFDTILLDVANFKTGPVMFINTKNLNIYAPYDGGSDIFIPDPTKKENSRLKYKNWLSNHPEGL